MEAAQLTAELKESARELGFTLAGVCPAIPPPGAARLDEWLAAGYAGEMDYIAHRRQAYDHPRSVLGGVCSILMLAMDYATSAPADIQPGQGRVARYAWGECDYHDLIHNRLKSLADRLRDLAPDSTVRGVVDTAPLMEREFAQLAGVGWVGKNTLLLQQERGSWFFLAALLTDVELVYDAPYTADHCGTCRACLDACPTNAFPQPYVLDASRCVSYLTIELKEQIPAELRAGLADWLFGCDVCQEVCPWNSKPAKAMEPSFQPVAENNPVELSKLFDLDEAEFRKRFRHTPLWRPKRRGILRNAAILLGNRPTPSALSALRKGLHDADSVVRGACAWALGQFAHSDAIEALRERRRTELDQDVIAEIDAALEAAVRSSE